MSASAPSGAPYGRLVTARQRSGAARPLNTQTHVLLAVAALARGRRGAPPRTPPTVVVALVLGAVLPDASLFVMWAQAKLAGVPEARIWGELYYSDLWQGVGAVTNSAPLYAAVALCGWLAGGRLVDEAARARRTPSVALAVGAAALLHVATDLPLHNDDGHPHFWPFSGWIYSSPVSYWDPEHYGRLWRAFEAALGLGLVALLWRRSEALWIEALLVLAALVPLGTVLYFTAQLG